MEAQEVSTLGVHLASEILIMTIAATKKTEVDHNGAVRETMVTEGADEVQEVEETADLV